METRAITRAVEKNGNEDKIITTFRKYVENLHNALVEDLKQGNIHENHITLLTQKI